MLVSKEASEAIGGYKVRPGSSVDIFMCRSYFNIRQGAILNL